MREDGVKPKVKKVTTVLVGERALTLLRKFEELRAAQERGKREESARKKMTATERGVQLATIPIREVPIPALKFAVFLCAVGGMCGETFITAYAIYAQVVEGFPPDEDGWNAATPRWREAYELAQKEYEHVREDGTPLGDEGERGILRRKVGLGPARMP